MELKDAREHYYYYSAQASAVVRQLCFAGIAIVWIFSGSDNPRTASVPADLVVPAFFLVAALAADLLQYVAASLVWGGYHRWREWRDQPEPFEAPRQINWPGNTFFALKLLMSGLAYVILTVRVLERVS